MKWPSLNPNISSIIYARSFPSVASIMPAPFTFAQIIRHKLDFKKFNEKHSSFVCLFVCFFPVFRSQLFSSSYITKVLYEYYSLSEHVLFFLGRRVADPEWNWNPSAENAIFVCCCSLFLRFLLLFKKEPQSPL